ncbi:MAG: hypothetical protein H6559_35960 [Lewinellaceae bacterium]|nr:hypothetical protein [Lewinellaceae bacterium]
MALSVPLPGAVYTFLPQPFQRAGKRCSQRIHIENDKIIYGTLSCVGGIFGVKEFMDKDGGAAAEITLESALVFLKKNKDETYTINSNPGDEEILDVVAIYKTSDSVPENSTIYQLSTTMNKDLSARKDIDNHWNIGIQKSDI